MDESSVDVVPCATFEEFVQKVRPTRYVMDRMFRGQQNSRWKLQSMFDRWLGGRFLGPGLHNYDALFSGGRTGRVEFARMQLEIFRRHVSGMPSVPADLLSDDMQLWALGRHHGLVTPLLDWTQSPYIAAFFAFFSRLEGNHDGFKYGAGFCGPITILSDPVAVWELYYEDSVFQKGQFEVLTGRRADAFRQKAQAGLFTFLMNDLTVSMDDFFVRRRLGHLLRRYEIPGTETRSALASLRQMNITYGTLFPDLDGAAIEANLESIMNTWSLGGS